MRYKLTVFSVPQGIVSMVMDAVSAEAACSEARRGGYSVLSATVLKEEAWAWRKERFDLMLFGHELLALMEAGMGLVEAVTLIAERMRSAASQATLAKILMQITQGQSFSSALESAPEAFPVLFVASVRASERTGMLADGIRSYMGYQQSLNALHNKVVSACVYPCVLIAVGSMVVLFLLSYVVPRFSQVYASMEQTQLPLMSRLLMQWGQLFAAHTGLIFSGLIGIAILTIGLLRLTPFRAILNRWLWGLPRVGEQLRICTLHTDCGAVAQRRCSPAHRARHDRVSAAPARVAARPGCGQACLARRSWFGRNFPIARPGHRGRRAPAFRGRAQRLAGPHHGAHCRLLRR